MHLRFKDESQRCWQAEHWESRYRERAGTAAAVDEGGRWTERVERGRSALTADEYEQDAL